MEETLLQTPSETPTEAPVTEAPVAEARPEWLPEKFADPADMAKAYGELEGKLGKGEEELRTKLMEEMETEAFAERPASVGEYVLPDTLDEAEAVDNQLLDWWSNYSWNNGLSQAMQQAVAELGSSSAGIKALEHIIEQTKSSSIAPTSVAGQLTQADIEAKMKDPRYWQQGRRDNAFIQEVNSDWQRLSGGR